MGASHGKTGGGATDLRAELVTLFGAIFRLAPGLSPPTDPHSVSLPINPALDLNPAYSKHSPSTIPLVEGYLTYNVYGPLFYLELVKRCVGDERDDDERKTMAMAAPELAEGSPFRDMSAAELLNEIRKGLWLLLTELSERKCELEEELKSLEERKRCLSAANAVLLIVVLAISPAALAAKVTPASITAMVMASIVVGTTLVATAAKVVEWWIGKRDDKRKRKLESQKDAIEVMRRGSGSALLLLPHDLEDIGSLLENLRTAHVALRAAAADHTEREAKVKQKKKAVKKGGIKGVRKKVDLVERDVKKAAADFMIIIAK